MTYLTDGLTVTNLHTNWKHNAPLDIELGPRVLLVGPNGSGKSAVYEAIELALTGAVSHYSGRANVRDPKRLWRAKPKRHKALWIDVTLSDGRKVSWRQERANGKPQWTLDGTKITELPVEVHARVSELRSELFGSAQRAEKYLTSALGLGTGRILSELPDTVRDLVGDLAAARKPTEVLESLRKMTREARAESKAAEQIERELEHHAGLPPTEDEIASTQMRLASTREALSNAAALETTARALRATMEEWRTLQAPGRVVQPVPVSGAHMLPLMEATRTMLRTVEKVLPSAQNCPCCQSPFGPAARSARDEALASATQGIYQARASDRAFQDQQDRLSALRDEATRLKAALPPTIFTDVLGGTDLDLSSELRDVTAALQATLEDQQARRVSAAAPQMARQRAEAAATRADVLKAAADAWEKAQSQVVESALAGLVAQASRYFPARFGTAKIKLRPSVDVGIDREGAVGAPSGAEEATLMLALAAALSDSATDSGYDLLVMEDRAVDPQSVTALLTSLTDWSTGQLFVQAIAQVGAVPGWTIHRFHREASGPPLASAALVKLAALRQRPITAADVSLISTRDADAT